MNRTFGNVNEKGNGSTEIQQGVHLYCALLIMEFGSEKQTKAQVNSYAVKRIDHIVQVNPEAVVIDVKGSCLLEEDPSKVGIDYTNSFSHWHQQEWIWKQAY